MWILGAVEYGVDDGAGRGYLVEYFERKPTNRRAAELVDCDGIHFRMAQNAMNACIEASEEIFSQARFPTFVPAVRFDYIVISLWREDNVVNHG